MYKKTMQTVFIKQINDISTLLYVCNLFNKIKLKQ